MMSHKVYEIITNRILAELEKGAVPWTRPWAPELAPQNFLSRKKYRGINSLLLKISSHQRRCPFFLTRNQVEKLGGRIRQGEERLAQFATFWRWIPLEDEETGDHKLIPFLRYYRLYNLSQTEGIDWSLPKKEKVDPLQSCEATIEAYQVNGGCPINHDGGSHSYYDLLDDSIHLPERDRFTDSVSYYSVLFHECIHSTGHSSRLERNLSTDMASQAYAREELTAEIGAAFLLGNSGVSESIPIANNAAYIKHWSRCLREDPRCVIYAASRAQRAADFILGIGEESAAQEDPEEYHEAA
jgi:antirestriction protein ArdC